MKPGVSITSFGFCLSIRRLVPRFLPAVHLAGTCLLKHYLLASLICDSQLSFKVWSDSRLSGIQNANFSRKRATCWTGNRKAVIFH
ncbi:MAG: hypothetical protein DMG97_36340 [Acidobacteria bacterium]|nr:MAG: hypothetical protein DMG97_36340 [Acidobacteriota bacterium]